VRWPAERASVPRYGRATRGAVDNAAVLGRNGNVGEQTAGQPGADRDATHRADHWLTAVDHIVDDVACLLPLPGPRRELVDIFLDDREIAARREHLAGARQDRGVDARVLVNIGPNIGELRMQCGICRIYRVVALFNA